MYPSFKIGNKIINKNSPTFIIAEAGVNHNGDMNLAKKLIVAAKKAGADCIKFQTFKSEKLVNKKTLKAKYQRATTNKNEDQLDMLKKLELNNNDFVNLIKFCKTQKIIFLSTPYNFADVDFLDKINVPAFKLASMHLSENVFIDYVAKKNKPFLVSTGMSNQKDVETVYELLKKQKNKNYCFLQCTTNYPIEYKEANLRVITTFKKKFKKIIGYSDHTSDYLACLSAVTLGAKIIEKHFTLDKTLPGPDHKSSINPKEFSEMVKKIRDIEVLLGSSIKTKNKNEISNEKYMKRGIVFNKDLKKGKIIKINDIDFMRPLVGLKPNDLKKIIGKRINNNVKKYSRVSLQNLK